MTGPCPTRGATCPATTPASISARAPSTWKTPAPMASSSTTPRRRRVAAACTRCATATLLRMGEYRIRVSIDADEGVLPPPGTGTLAVDLRRQRRAAARSGAGRGRPGRFAQHRGADRRRRPAARAKLAPLTYEGSARRGRPAAVGAGTLSPAARRGPGAPGRGATPRCPMCAQRAAGLLSRRRHRSRTLPMENEAQSLQLVGRMLREALGLKEILRAQQAFCDRYRHRDRQARRTLAAGTGHR